MRFTENILKCLKKEELRYIEKTAFLGKEVQPKTLYELLLKFPEEEEKVIARFKKAAPKANITVIRNQLSQILLSSVYQQYVPEYAFAEVNELLLQIQVFVKKSAFEVVKKLLERAIKNAEENELFTQHIELLEITLSLYQSRVLTDAEGKEKMLKLIPEIWQKKQNHLEYQLILFKQMELLNQSFSIKTDDTQAKVEEIMNKELMLATDKALSTKATLEYWIIKGQFFSITHNFEAAADAFEQVISVLDKKPAIKKQRHMHYLSICAQLATYGYILQKPSLMQKAIQAIADSEKHTEIEQIASLTFLVNSNMAYYDLIKDKVGLKQTIRDAHELLKKYIEKIKHDVQTTLILACVSGYAEFGEYEKLLQMLTEFSSYVSANIRIDIKMTLFFYELIAQIETGNEQLVNDTLQNFNRFLLRNEIKGEFEQIMIRFLKVISSQSLHSKKELTQLKTQLTELPQKSLQNQNRILYDILTNMIDSKLAGKKFHEYLMRQTDGLSSINKDVLCG